MDCRVRRRCRGSCARRTIDEAGTPRLTTHGWTEDSGLPLWDCLDTYSDAGAIHVLCTDVARDGAMSGPNFALYAEILQRYHALQLQASGGVRNLDDLEMLRELGLPAAITGRALLDGEITEAEVTHSGETHNSLPGRP